MTTDLVVWFAGGVFMAIFTIVVAFPVVSAALSL